MVLGQSETEARTLPSAEESPLEGRAPLWSTRAEDVRAVWGDRWGERA